MTKILCIKDDMDFILPLLQEGWEVHIVNSIDEGQKGEWSSSFLLIGVLI